MPEWCILLAVLIGSLIATALAYGRARAVHRTLEEVQPGASALMRKFLRKRGL